MKAKLESTGGMGIDAEDMKIGQLGYLHYEERDHLVLCNYNCIVSLDDPMITFRRQVERTVILLPPGTRVTIESEI